MILYILLFCVIILFNSITITKCLYICKIKYIDFCSYFLVKLTMHLPSFIFIKAFQYHSNINEDGYYDLDFDITEYLCNLNQRFYKVRFINFDDKTEKMNNFTKNIEWNIENRNLISHASLQKNGEYIKDVTEELRSFFHYIPSKLECNQDFIFKLRQDNIWKYIKCNIGFNDDLELLISLNDVKMTDLIITF